MLNHQALKDEILKSMEFTGFVTYCNLLTVVKTGTRTELDVVACLVDLSELGILTLLIVGFEKGEDNSHRTIVVRNPLTVYQTWEIDAIGPREGVKS